MPRLVMNFGLPDSGYSRRPSLTITLEEFKESVAKIRKGSKRVRCTNEMKAFAIQYAQDRVSNGETIGTCTQRLFIAGATLRIWIRNVDGGLRQVQIEVERPHLETLTVVTPRGYRVEGLSIEFAGALLRFLA